MEIERRVTLDGDCLARKPHDCRAFRQPDGTYHAICLGCGKDWGPVDVSHVDTIVGVGYFFKDRTP